MVVATFADRRRLQSLDRLKAAGLLAADNVRAAVVSRHVSNCSAGNPATIAPKFLGGAPRIGIEAAVEGEWARWLGNSGEFVGMTGFGASAPAEVLYREFGITAEAVASRALQAIARSRMAAAV